MVEHTPSYLAAAAMMDNRANAIFFVGYADADTPAARLQATPYGDQFSFKDLFFVGNVNCRVDKFDLTSHADREQLLEFIMEKDPRCVVLTHRQYRIARVVYGRDYRQVAENRRIYSRAV